MNYQLTDCHKMHEAHPKTFGIPGVETIEALSPGSFVKLIFEPTNDDHPTERMWVQIEKIEDGKFVGVLDNDPFFFPSEKLSLGAKVEFEVRHIAGTLGKE